MNTCVTATFVMPDACKLAEERSESTQEPFLGWYDALSKGIMLANAAMIDPDAFLMLAHNCTRFSQFILVIEALNAHAKENPYGANAFNLFDYYVEESKYSLKEWLEVLEHFYSWLARNGRRASLTTILSYISGCTQSKDPIEAVDSNFKDAVEKVLITFGFQD